ncbi:MAG: hypothetical protein ABI723_21850 [Bacteroidia bacterium]
MERDLFIQEDKFMGYRIGMPYFTTLLGEVFYPDDFWFDVGGILIRTSDTIEDIEEKIDLILKKDVYEELDAFHYKILSAEEITIAHPEDYEIKIPGEDAYDFFVKYLEEKSKEMDS